MSQLLTLGHVRLVTGSGPDATRGIAQPKRLALLAYLAMAATDAPVRRDALLALFWPELGQEEGRRALRQALYYLRRVIGDDLIVTTGDELTMREASLECDAVRFERLIAAGRFTDALELYRGDFFDSLHIDDVGPELEEWVVRTRSRLRRRASSAAWTASDGATVAGDSARAIELAKRGCELEPDQEAGWRRLMRLQDRTGDRDGALHTYDTLATRLERELDATPSPETSSLAERIRTAPPGETPPEPDVLDGAPPSKQPGWRLPIIGGLVAVVLIAGGLGAYIRLSDGDRDLSLVAAGSLSARDRIVVADFANLAGDSLLAAGITEAFRVDLGQSPLVRVLSSRQVADALTRMERQPGTALGDSLAREVAAREGAKATVSGSIAKVGGGYSVTVQLLGTEQGNLLAAFRESAADSSVLLDAVDRASKSLRHRIGESLGTLRALPPLPQETTGSLAALRRYAEAQRLSLAGRRTEAIRLYEEAIALDTAFASAYMALAMTYEAIAELGRARAARRRAFEFQQRLPFFERNYAIASFAYGQGDYETAASAYTRLLDRYPTDVRVINNLALVHQDRRQFAVAESLFRRAASIDSMIPNLYFGIHGTQLLQGKFREGRETLDLIAHRFPNDPVLMIVETQDASAQQNWEKAERHAETRIGALAGDTLSLVDPYEGLAGIVMTQGRLAEAERHWRTHLKLSAASDSRGRHVFGLLQLARLHQRYRNAPARALALVDSALAATPLDSVLPGDRPYDDLARFYASAGRLTRARQLLATAETNDSVLGRAPGPDRTWTRGVIALGEGRATVAEAELRQAADGLVCPICALPDLARAYEAVRKPDAAVAVYERYLTTPWFFRYEPDASELGWAMHRLAELYDARGETAKATAVRGRLLQLWRRADPELQPVVAQVRAKRPG